MATPTKATYLFGYRGASLDEYIHIGDDTVALSLETGTPVGTRIQSFDRFEVENRFQGFTLGTASHQSSRDRLQLLLTTKLSLGNVASDVQIRGATVTTQPNANR